MKQAFKILFLLCISSYILSSCRRDDTATITTTTSLKLSLTKTTIVADGFDYTTVAAIDQNGVDVADYASIFVGTNYSAKTLYFNYTEVGTYKVYAIRNGVTSDTVTITVTNPGTAKYSTKVLMEQYNGTWAGWVPRMDLKLAQFQAANPKIIVSTSHYKDALTNYYEDSTLRYRFGIAAWPSAVINRRVGFNENGNVFNAADSTELNAHLKVRAVTGLAINTSISGNTLTITPKVGFDVAISDSLKLVVNVLEDNIVSPQKNYYNQNVSYPANPFFNSGDTIKTYQHKNVLRKSPTTSVGQIIDATKQVKGGEYSTTYTVDITGYNPANLKVVAFVIFADNQRRIGVLNAQVVKAGQNQNYD